MRYGILRSVAYPQRTRFLHRICKRIELQATSALVCDDEVVERVSILKPRFTSLANEFWDSGLMRELKPSELLLILTLYRFTSGFQKVRCVVGEAKLSEVTGLPASSLYEAKRGLLRRGLISVSYTASGRCCYELVERLQTVRDKPEVTAKSAPPSRPSGVPEGYPYGTPESCKDKKENIDHHHNPCPVAAAQPPQPDTEKPAPNCRSARFDDASSLSQSGGGDAELTRSLARQLQDLGVNAFVAGRLARTQPGDKITAAIQRVRVKNPANPAAYLVAEIQRGGYGDAPADKTRLIRQAHDELHQKRQQERQRDLLEQDLAHAKTLEALALFESLATQDQAELHRLVEEQAAREGFVRIPGWGVSHPAYRGLLSELVGRRYLPHQRVSAAYSNGHYAARE